jgi:CelD/BcsL family acetyltransferase involved in cellulose biosynthesis
MTYVPYGSRPWRLLRLGAGAEEYFSKMSSKSRGNLRKRVKQLTARGDGMLELVRVEAEDQTGEFLREAAAVSRKTWQHRVLGARVSDAEEERAEFTAVARRGLLRSYTLRCGGEPCAFVVGHQYGGVYHYNELGYDPAYADFSPGTVLLYLLIQDLFAHRPPRILNFGVGDADYKRRFGNVQMEDSSVLVFRRSLRGQLLTTGHSGFRAFVKVARRVMRRSRAV